MKFAFTGRNPLTLAQKAIAETKNIELAHIGHINPFQSQPNISNDDRERISSDDFDGIVVSEPGQALMMTYFFPRVGVFELGITGEPIALHIWSERIVGADPSKSYSYFEHK